MVERGKTDPLANKSTPKKWIGNKNGRGRPKKAEEEEAKQNKLAKLKEDTQVGYISQKYTWNKYTLEKQ